MTEQTSMRALRSFVPALFGQGSDQDFDRLADDLNARESGVMIAVVLGSTVRARLCEDPSMAEIAAEARRIRAMQPAPTFPLMYFEAAIRMGAGKAGAGAGLDPEKYCQAVVVVINNELDALTASADGGGSAPVRNLEMDVAANLAALASTAR